MALQKLDHVSILTKDPQPVVDFYSNCLGFEKVSDKTIENMGMRIIMLKKDEDMLEFIQPLQKNSKQTDGIKHVAYLSDNIEEELERIKQTGATLLHDRVQQFENIQFFFVKSPSGEMVEIVQYINE